MPEVKEELNPMLDPNEQRTATEAAKDEVKFVEELTAEQKADIIVELEAIEKEYCNKVQDLIKKLNPNVIGCYTGIGHTDIDGRTIWTDMSSILTSHKVELFDYAKKVANQNLNVGA